MFNDNRYDQTPNEYICPITDEIMEDPVITTNGQTYDRRAIEQWFQTGKRTDPLTNEELIDIKLIPNLNLRKLIQDYQSSLNAMERAVINNRRQRAYAHLRDIYTEKFNVVSDKIDYKKSNCVIL